jgi:hypothetical protein
MNGHRTLAGLALSLALLALSVAARANAAGSERLGGQIALPAGAASFDLADEVLIGARPTRIRLFRVAQPLPTVQAHFRKVLGTARIETEHGGWRLLARQDGARLIGVRLRATDPRHTEGSVAVTALDAAPARPLEITLPTASRLSGDVETSAQGRSARTLVWHNRHSVALNVRHLLRQLSRRGYRLEREVTIAGGRSVWFGGDGRDALALVTARATETEVVLQLVRPQGEAR